MKCSYCKKEINETTEKYHVLTLDGDFIHDVCKDDYEKQKHFYDNINTIEELLKPYNG